MSQQLSSKQFSILKDKSYIYYLCIEILSSPLSIFYGLDNRLSKNKLCTLTFEGTTNTYI
jgi:hypothetical protein